MFKHSLPRGPSGRISKERLWEILTSAVRELTTHKHPEVWVVDIGSWLVKNHASIKELTGNEGASLSAELARTPGLAIQGNMVSFKK